MPFEIYDIDKDTLKTGVEYLNKKFPKFTFAHCYTLTVNLLYAAGVSVEGEEPSSSTVAMQYAVARRSNLKKNSFSKTTFNFMIDTMKDFGIKRTSQCMDIVRELLRVVEAPKHCFDKI